MLQQLPLMRTLLKDKTFKHKVKDWIIARNTVDCNLGKNAKMTKSLRKNNWINDDNC